MVQIGPWAMSGVRWNRLVWWNKRTGEVTVRPRGRYGQLTKWVTQSFQRGRPWVPERDHVQKHGEADTDTDGEIMPGKDYYGVVSKDESEDDRYDTVEKMLSRLNINSDDEGQEGKASRTHTSSQPDPVKSKKDGGKKKKKGKKLQPDEVPPYKNRLHMSESERSVFSSHHEHDPYRSKAEQIIGGVCRKTISRCKDMMRLAEKDRNVRQENMSPPRRRYHEESASSSKRRGSEDSSKRSRRRQ